MSLTFCCKVNSDRWDYITIFEDTPGEYDYGSVDYEPEYDILLSYDDLKKVLKFYTN